MSCQLAAVDSVKLPWAEEMECGWTAAVVRDDLLALRDFLKQGMEVKVIEEMVHTAHLQLAELTRIFMPPPFEEWWRGIKCYPCPCIRSCVRPSVIKI